ncbi:fasciclin-3 isoform X2 [Anthonomus grandis grandis]|uniref:fasciclin-3 isoform X2 n=1 Tax=Anthonomus grandis grandis TaxID=2921223 RepID=UPI00216635CD|nr:fasciclin-3 isoform X2 [Anthonomus grandis grandis]
MELVTKGEMLLVALVMGFLTQGIFAVQVDVDKREQTVLVGQPATFMCRVAVPLQYCRVEIPGMKSYNLNKGISNSDVSYAGEGLDAGQCGFTVNRAKDENNGEIKCTLGIASEAQESVGTMSLIVARQPKLPELDLSSGTDHLNVYKVDDILQAVCVVADGRPVANITWMLDDEPIPTNERSVIQELAKENLQSKIQNLTRRLMASDNGKFLKCVAYHPAYPGGKAEAKRRLDIKYAPQPKNQPIEEFGYEIGKTGVINVTIEANPRPSFEWTVNGQKIREGSHDTTGIMEAEIARDLGNGSYVATLRIARISKHDTEKDYILNAYNDQGSMEYRVKISTNPEPKGYEIGMAAIVGIIAAILALLIVVGLLIFAKISGKWCFSGNGENRYIAESDTESADVIRTKESKHRRLPSAIQLTAQFFRKRQDKVATETTEPTVKNLESDEADSATITAEEQEKQAEDVAKIVNEKTDKDKGLVYAELDLIRAANPNMMVPVIKNDDEKTEYAEIVYTPAKDGEEIKDQLKDKK